MDADLNARLDWLMLFLGAPGGPYPADQFRVMKGMFLLSRAADHPTATLYRFKPYDYGPVEPGINRDLDRLRLADLIRFKQPGNSPRKTYELTESGWSRYAELAATVSEDQTAAVHRAKERATSNDVETLINHLYAEFPEFLVEYERTEGAIAGDADGTVTVWVYEHAPAPEKTSSIAIDRIGGQVTVKTDLGNHLGLELHIPVGEQAWGPARPVIASAKHMIELVSAYGPDSSVVAALGPIFVEAVARALVVRERYPPPRTSSATGKPDVPGAPAEADGALVASRA